MVEISEKEIRHICERAITSFMEQPILLEISSPINICGNNKK
jgi:hypothetical protein